MIPVPIPIDSFDMGFSIELMEMYQIDCLSFSIIRVQFNQVIRLENDLLWWFIISKSQIKFECKSQITDLCHTKKDAQFLFRSF